MTGELTLRQADVERMVLAARDRQRGAQLLGKQTDVAIYTIQVNRWLDLWQPMVTDGSVQVPA